MEDSRDELKKKEDRLRARTKMMDHIARRDHSESELRRKMQDNFEPGDVDAALEYAKAQGWVPQTDDAKRALAEKFAETLHRRKKGIHFINESLAEKGLPSLPADPERELEKARDLLETKFSKTGTWDRQAQEKAGRFLASRGFDMDVIREVVFNRNEG